MTSEYFLIYLKEILKLDSWINLADTQWNFKKNIGIITGFTYDINDNQPEPSLFLTVSFSDPLKREI